jgi:hypothetical protein
MKRVVDKEQFFTNDRLVRKCVSALRVHEYDTIVEPSAAAGAFLNHLPKRRTIALDIDPQDDRVTLGNFLTWTPPSVTHPDRTLVVGNPPYGARGALAVQFVNKACEFADTVAFILPRSFQKYTFQNRVNERFHLTSSFLCDDFAKDGKPHAVKSVFQVWEKHETVRRKTVPVNEHSHFELRHAHMSRVNNFTRKELHKYDIAIGQVGNFPVRDPRNVTNGSYWFVKFNKGCVAGLFHEMNFNFLRDMNTTFPGLSKSDIVTAYVNALNSQNPNNHSG